MSTISCICTSVEGATSTQSISNHYSLQVELEKIYLDPTWLALLHYSRFSNGSFFSQADSDDFFISKQGRSDPKKELNALISLIVNSNNENTMHCKFPARTKWITQKLKISSPDYSICQAYKEFQSQFPQNQISIVFASFSTKSPSSLMGHTFLSFSSNEDERLLSMTANYLANIETAKNTIDYAYRGIIGGFPGKVYTSEFFKLSRRYQVNEVRELWTYPINLTPDEINVIISHLWEIKDEVFDYYFFSENCSYRILSILATVKPELIDLQRFKNKTIPLDTLRELDAQGLLGSGKYTPSSKTAFNNLTQSMSTNEKRLVYDLAHGNVDIKNANFDLYPIGKTLLLIATHKYLSIEIETRIIPLREGQPRILALLERLKQSNISSIEIPERQSGDPLNSHKTSRFNFSLGEDELGFANFGYRLAGHNWQDPQRNTFQGVEAEYFNINLRIDENQKVFLEKFNLVDLYSKPRYSYFFPERSWGIRLGSNRELSTQGSRDLVGAFSAQYGISGALSNTTFGTLLSLSIEHLDHNKDHVQSSYGLKFFANTFNENYNFRFERRRKFYSDNNLEPNSSTNLTLSFDQSKDLRFYVSVNQEKTGSFKILTTSIGLNTYF